MMVELYGDQIYHNDGNHLDGDMTNNTLWLRFWNQLAAQSASWYTPPPGAVGWRFIMILVLEWKGVRVRIWNSDQTLVFTHIILKNTPVASEAKEIRKRISRALDLWEEGRHYGLVK